jgi:bifunctional non-homologous end joining protein LigD
VAEILGDADPWTLLMPPPQVLDPGLVEEGHTIPVARVAAMHAGKRRARARRDASDPGSTAQA